ncbi:MAG: DUF4350 domain-containing protein [Bacteroidota bacterium]
MKGYRLYLIMGSVLLASYLLAQYYKPEPTNWTSSYLKEDKIPFGTYILYQQVQDLFPGSPVIVSNKRIYNTLKDKQFKNANYLLLASQVDVDRLDLRELLKFMRDGNHVFMASFKLADILRKNLGVESGSSFSYTDSQTESVNFSNPLLKSKKNYLFKKGLASQYYTRFDTSSATVLGKNKAGKANFLRYNFGKGSLYLLPNPQLLTNYSLLSAKGSDYAGKALSYLPTGRTLIWDEFNSRGSTDDKSVLRVIFGNEYLRWAYYLALTGLVVFVLFQMKRRQRIIPVIVQPANSSVDFVKVVGKVYYQQRDNQDIADKKSRYFLAHIRSTYQLKTNELDDELQEKLCMRSGADPATVSKIFGLINQISKGFSVDDKMLILFNQLTEQFYKQVQ